MTGSCTLTTCRILIKNRKTQLWLHSLLLSVFLNIYHHYGYHCMPLRILPHTTSTTLLFTRTTKTSTTTNIEPSSSCLHVIFFLGKNMQFCNKKCTMSNKRLKESNSSSCVFTNDFLQKQIYSLNEVPC